MRKDAIATSLELTVSIIFWNVTRLGKLPPSFFPPPPHHLPHTTRLLHSMFPATPTSVRLLGTRRVLLRLLVRHFIL